MPELPKAKTVDERQWRSVHERSSWGSEGLRVLPKRAHEEYVDGALAEQVPQGPQQSERRHPGAPMVLMPDSSIWHAPVMIGPAQVSVAWWHWFELVCRKVTNHDLHYRALEWLAGESRARGAEGWYQARDLPEYPDLVRRASATMALCISVTLKELESLPGFTGDGQYPLPTLSREGPWSRVLGRPQLSWNEALRLTRDPQSWAQVEPYGPCLDPSGLIPGEIKIQGKLKKQQERLWRELSGQPWSHERTLDVWRKSPEAKKDPECLPPAEVATAWFHERPDQVAERANRAQHRQKWSAENAVAQVVRSAAEYERQQRQQQLNRAPEAKTLSDTPINRSLNELSSRMKAVIRGEVEDEGLSGRIRSVQHAWGEVSLNIPHLRPILAGLELELDPVQCALAKVQGMGVDAEARVIYINLAAGYTEDEIKYGVAQMALHLALGHPARAEGKNPAVWSLACELLLAGWLHQMHWGQRPERAPWHDELCFLEPAEAIYLRLLDNPTLMRRQGTLRGSLPVMMGGAEENTSESDEHWRSKITQGMDEVEAMRWVGSLPGDMLRSLRERAAPALPWRPTLQAYLGQVVPRQSRRRTYARPSRRSGLKATEPKVARLKDEPGPRHSLLVVIDTSGSVSDRLIEEALGGIRATCATLEIDRLRVISCDAGATDHGWSEPWRAGQRVELTGGGGTSLIPAMRLIEQLTESGVVHAETPLLIVTDGLFDEVITPRREHAWLLPKYATLNFKTSAPVFRLPQAH